MSPSSTYTTSIECTGSMNPAITCFDMVTFNKAHTIDDINVGTIINFPDCEVPDADYTVVHRVSEVWVSGDTEYYRTKGDNNPSEDSCWTPYSDVYFYVTNVKEMHPADGMALLEKIWVSEAKIKTLDNDANMELAVLHALAINGYFAEYNKRIPQYNIWVDEYRNEVEVEVKLRAELQALKDGMEEYK